MPTPPTGRSAVGAPHEIHGYGERRRTRRRAGVEIAAAGTRARRRGARRPPPEREGDARARTRNTRAGFARLIDKNNLFNY